MEKNEVKEEKTINLPAEQSEDLSIFAPGKLRVVKRNGKNVPFEKEKIEIAITKAFLAAESGNAASSERIHEKSPRAYRGYCGDIPRKNAVRRNTIHRRNSRSG